jgi:non-ribosomal peptide synthetase component F
VACWERTFLESETACRQIEYWRGHLRGAPRRTGLLPDGPAHEPGDFRSIRQTHLVPARVAETLRRLSREERCTLSMTLLAGLNALVHELTGEDDIITGSPLAGRLRPEIQGTIGCLRKRVVLRSDLSGKPTFRELLKRTREIVAGAYANLDVTYETVFPDRGVDHPQHWMNIPLNFNFVEGSGQSLAFPGLVVTSMERSEFVSWVTLNIQVTERERDLVIHFLTPHTLLSAAQANGFLQSYGSLLQRVAEAPDHKLSAASMPTT